MKPVKIAATTLMPLIFLNGRHPHIEGHTFVAETQPSNPFVLLSTATSTSSLTVWVTEAKWPK